MKQEDVPWIFTVFLVVFLFTNLIWSTIHFNVTSNLINKRADTTTERIEKIERFIETLKH